MTPEADKNQQGAAFGPPLLGTAQVMKLTDAAQTLFGTLYDIEKAMKRVAKNRLAAEMDKLDLFGPTEHYLGIEDYEPGGES